MVSKSKSMKTEMESVIQNVDYNLRYKELIESAIWEIIQECVPRKLSRWIGHGCECTGLGNKI